MPSSSFRSRAPKQLHRIVVDLLEFLGANRVRQKIRMIIEVGGQILHALRPQVLEHRDQRLRIDLPEREWHVVKQKPVALFAPAQCLLGLLALGDVDHPEQAHARLASRPDPRGGVQYVDDAAVEREQLGFCRIVRIAAIARHHRAPERGGVLGKVAGDGGADELARVATAEHLNRVLVDLLDDEHLHAALQEVRDEHRNTRPSP